MPIPMTSERTMFISLPGLNRNVFLSYTLQPVCTRGETKRWKIFQMKRKVVVFFCCSSFNPFHSIYNFGLSDFEPFSEIFIRLFKWASTNSHTDRTTRYVCSFRFISTYVFVCTVHRPPYFVFFFFLFLVLVLLYVLYTHTVCVYTNLLTNKQACK